MGEREWEREERDREERDREEGRREEREEGKRNWRWRVLCVTGETMYMALVNISLPDLYYTQNQFIGRSHDCSSPVTSSGGGIPVA